MKLRKAIWATLKSKRFWVWQLSGAILYAIPAAIRFATGNVRLPILSLLETPVLDHYIPSNLIEKVLVNAFFPGGAGGVAGELIASNNKGEALGGKAKYLSRLAGALLQTAAWSAFQYWGYSLMILGPWSIGGNWGNIFECWTVFPLNFTIAAFSIFTPDVVKLIGEKIKNTYEKLSRQKNEN